MKTASQPSTLYLIKKTAKATPRVAHAAPPPPWSCNIECRPMPEAEQTEGHLEPAVGTRELDALQSPPQDAWHTSHVATARSRRRDSEGRSVRGGEGQVRQLCRQRSSDTPGTMAMGHCDASGQN